MLRARQLAARLRSTPGVSPEVAEAMIAVPRHRFVKWRQRLRAYDDRSLPTRDGQSISQPTYIARVLSSAEVRPGDRVLEVGAGSGYTAAVLARLAREVVTVERIPELAEGARRRLARTPNVRVITGDGCHAAEGTFDAILVMAGAPSVPPSYVERLRDGGRLVIPVGERSERSVSGHVVRVTRRGAELVEEVLMPGDWNPLVGQDGWRV